MHNILSCVFFSRVQAQLPVLTARLCSQFCFSAHISLHEFNVQDTLFEAVFHSHLKENTNWKKKKVQTCPSRQCCIQGQKILEWPRGTVKVQCDMLCYDGLMACVGSSEVNITKILQRVLDGDIQPGSHRGNMPHTDRIILIDDFNYFKSRCSCSYSNCSFFL